LWLKVLCQLKFNGMVFKNLFFVTIAL